MGVIYHISYITKQHVAEDRSPAKPSIRLLQIRSIARSVGRYTCLHLCFRQLSICFVILPILYVSIARSWYRLFRGSRNSVFAVLKSPVSQPHAATLAGVATVLHTPQNPTQTAGALPNPAQRATASIPEISWRPLRVGQENSPVSGTHCAFGGISSSENHAERATDATRFSEWRPLRVGRDSHKVALCRSPLAVAFASAHVEQRRAVNVSSCANAKPSPGRGRS